MTLLSDGRVSPAVPVVLRSADSAERSALVKHSGGIHAAQRQDGPDERGVPLDEGVPGLLVAFLRSRHQVIDQWASADGPIIPVHKDPPHLLLSQKNPGRTSYIFITVRVCARVGTGCHSR